MEIKKEDLKMFRIVDTHFVAFAPSFLDDMPEVIPEKVIEMIVEEEVKEPTEEELAAIAKTEKIAKMKAELAALEE